MKQKVVIFDLDDTLYDEVDYIEKKKLKPYMGVELTLTKLLDMRCKLGMLTNGEEKVQMLKLKKLGLNKWFTKENIVTSEAIGSPKPQDGMYRHVMEQYPGAEFFYVGNNLEKDFVAANALGWVTICMMDNGRHIHPQDFTMKKEYLPKYRVRGISEIIKLIEDE
ncbi:MAG: HAD-IA family hydrolase [Prevotella sp.]|nr:HAD-IA family hydrolase [Prevotella sp.]